MHLAACYPKTCFYRCCQLPEACIVYYLLETCIVMYAWSVDVAFVTAYFMWLLHIQSDQLREKEQEIQQQRQQMLRLQNRITATNEQLVTLQKQLSTKDEQLASRDHQLQQKEAATAAHQQEIQELRQQLQFSAQVNHA